MLILLPPSEGKTAPRRGRPLDLGTLSFPALREARQGALEALVELGRTQPPELAAEVLGLGRTQADLVAQNGALTTAPTARADVVYTGVLYESLDATTLSPGARRRAGSSLAVTSCLFGLVRPGDRIPAYRLSPQVVLPGIGRVAQHWAAALAPVVEQARGRGLVVDLRSGAYLPFWRPPRGDTAVASIRVLHEAGGRRTVVSHFNKATKGRIARALLEDGSRIGSVAQLAELLRDLGWVVEADGTRLDVVVGAL